MRLICCSTLLLGCLLVSKLCTTEALPQIFRTEDAADTIEIVGLESDGSLTSTTGYLDWERFMILSIKPKTTIFPHLVFALE